ncbi:MAG: hypothetical protein Q7W30_06985 [Coriobacteriia bacterium]|nr:hypothetical protein [Coriobacteriia bacterium]
MYTTDRKHSTSRVLDRLRADAELRGTPEAVAAAAVAATTAFASATRGVTQSRIENYFWGVVRRYALRGDAPAMRVALLAASLEDELVRAGHSQQRVHEAVERAYGGAASVACIAPGPSFGSERVA